MEYSEVDICNIALSMLGAELIHSFDENNKRARLSKSLYEFSRDHILTQLSWAFAEGYAELDEVVLTTDVPEGMTTYQLPNDCLKPSDIKPRGSKDYWAVRGKVLYTSVSPVYLYYTRKIVDINLFSMPFVNVLSAYLAFRLAPAISQNPKMVTQMREGYLLSIQESYSVEASGETQYKDIDGVYDEDTFVNPNGFVDPASSRFLEAE